MMHNTDNTKNDVLLHEKSGTSDVWYVQGRRWNGMVTKRPYLPFRCTCDQYLKHKYCIHIRTVKLTLKQ